MDQPTPGSNYKVKEGETLSSIALQAYGPDNRWQEIYIVNTLEIGDNPNVPLTGKVLFIPQIGLHYCTVTALEGINIRAAANTHSAIFATYPQGTVLNYDKVVQGEPVNGTADWGHSMQGHYYWLGATDYSNG